MGLIERFTRDAASKYVWSIMALLAGIALVYAVTAGGEAVDRELRTSQARAAELAREAVIPELEDVDLSAPLADASERSIASTIERDVLSDDRVTRVRIWTVHGLLLFSSDGEDRPGTRTSLNDALLRDAARQGTLTRTDFSDTGGADDPERRLVRTFVPVSDEAVIEVDQAGARTLQPVESTWFRYQLVIGGALLLLLVLTALSLRDPVEPINVGVPFAVSSVPAGYSLIDNERLDAVHEVYRLASERVARLQERLEESEAERRRLEGTIQQELSKASSPSGPKKPAKAPPSAVDAPVAPARDIAPAAAPIVVPESEVVSSPRGSQRAGAPAGPLARASRDQRPFEESGRKKAAGTSKAKKSKRKTQPKVKRQPAEPPRGVVAVPDARPTPSPTSAPAAPPPSEPADRPKVSSADQPPAASVPEPIEIPPAAAPAAADAPPPAEPARRPRQVAAVGAKSKGRRAAQADPDLEDAQAHEAALETFIRLTESDRQRHEAAEVDQGAVRAALARTAARKKPGGEGLHRPGADDKPQERLGGPPPQERR